jgi:hypothetical protein
VIFPAELNSKGISGEILFYRPSDATKDFKFQLSTENSAHEVPLQNFSKGMYKMQLSWTAGQTAYFTEQVLVIP